MTPCDIPTPAHMAGQGSPLVLLHGLGGTWHIWKPVLPALEAHHRVIALTLPGHHGAPAYDGSGDAAVAGLADQVIDTLRQQGIARAHVAGNSLGGWLAIELARRGFAMSVTAFSPAGAWRSDADYRAVATPFRIFYAIVGVILFIARLFNGATWLRKALTRQMMEHGERLSAADFLGMLRAMANTSVLRGLLRTMGRDGPVAPLDAGSVPIRIAWGACDAVIPYPRYGAPFVERIGGAEATTVAGVGHVPTYDDPARIAASILEVTRRAEESSARADDAPAKVLAATDAGRVQ
ncbi:MAG TPA: alpha/beta fold hydrolase [Rubrivivax sp.]|nr:alpha/beta fold hydrolase [Rubrivivax sp.]